MSETPETETIEIELTGRDPFAGMVQAMLAVQVEYAVADIKQNVQTDRVEEAEKRVYDALNTINADMGLNPQTGLMALCSAVAASVNMPMNNTLPDDALIAVRYGALCTLIRELTVSIAKTDRAEAAEAATATKN